MRTVLARGPLGIPIAMHLFGEAGRLPLLIAGPGTEPDVGVVACEHKGHHPQRLSELPGPQHHCHEQVQRAPRCRSSLEGH